MIAASSCGIGRNAAKICKVIRGISGKERSSRYGASISARCCEFACGSSSLCVRRRVERVNSLCDACKDEGSGVRDSNKVSMSICLYSSINFCPADVYGVMSVTDLGSLSSIFDALILL